MRKLVTSVLLVFSAFTFNQIAYAQVAHEATRQEATEGNFNSSVLLDLSQVTCVNVIC